MACAPPSLNNRETPATRAACRIVASGRGHTATISLTPAVAAGMAVISSDEGYAALPPGTYNYDCDVPFHAERGMVGQFTVTP